MIWFNHFIGLIPRLYSVNANIFKLFYSFIKHTHTKNNYFPNWKLDELSYFFRQSKFICCTLDADFIWSCILWIISFICSSNNFFFSNFYHSANEYCQFWTRSDDCWLPIVSVDQYKFGHSHSFTKSVHSINSILFRLQIV